MTEIAEQSSDPVIDRPVPLGRRVTDLARMDPTRESLVFVRVDGTVRHLTTKELDERSTQLARVFISHGTGVGDRIAIALRNSPEHVIAALAAWKAGAGIVTMRWDVPRWERDRLLDVTQPKLIVAVAHDGVDKDMPVVSPDGGVDQSTEPLPDAVPLQPMFIPTGGSTGASKAVVIPMPGAIVPGQAMGQNYATFGIEPIDRHLIFAPLYHSNPLIMLHASLFDGHQVILHEKFDPAQIVTSIATHRPQFMTLAPTMMKRLVDHTGIEHVDWSCFHMILHGTAPTPPWLKRRFIDLVGAERLWEIFASSELNGSIVVRGDEWLAHPGTVGRPTVATELKILDENQRELPVGQVGEIYMRIKGTRGPLFDYLGQDRPKATHDGFTSVGDLGYLDAAGYVYSADRRKDLIISGGANIVPAEVEAAIGEHPAVSDVAVIGLLDEEWGQRVHALVVPRPGHTAPTSGELDAHCRERLARYKVPRSFEIVDDLPRSEMFKIRRSDLVTRRS